MWNDGVEGFTILKEKKIIISWGLQCSSPVKKWHLIESLHLSSCGAPLFALSNLAAQFAVHIEVRAPRYHIDFATPVHSLPCARGPLCPA